MSLWEYCAEVSRFVNYSKVVDNIYTVSLCWHRSESVGYCVELLKRFERANQDGHEEKP